MYKDFQFTEQDIFTSNLKKQRRSKRSNWTIEFEILSSEVFT